VVAAAARKVLATAALVAVATLSASAQRFGGGRFGSPGVPPAHPYDGSFTFARLYYNYHPGWSYDYPEMEQNLTGILNLITNLKSNPKGTDILRMDDPEIFRHPIAYISEPGYWYPSDTEAAMLRDYVAKGGFLVIDDFHYDNEWAVFDAAIHKVLPDAKLVRLDKSHAVFNTFFQIPSLHIPYPGPIGQGGLYGEFYGIFRDNDEKKPLRAIVNYNMDIGDYMEWSGSGFYAVDPSNEAFKFMINYLVYGFTR
jgi:hypothetical protein